MATIKELAYFLESFSKATLTGKAFKVDLTGSEGSAAELAALEAIRAAVEDIEITTGDIKIDTDAINLNTDDLEEEIGATDEAAAATDTSTSGLNGLIKRLLQRMTTLIAFFRLGQGTMDQSLAVTIASDQSAIPVSFSAGGAQVFTSAAEINSTNSPVTAGATNVTFTTSSDFAGTINGVARDISTSYDLTAASGKTLPAIPYTVTAGTLVIDKLV